MPASMNIETAERDGAVVIAVQGDVDLSTAPRLDTHLAFDITQPALVLDVSAVDFIDSTGLRSIISADQNAKSAGKEFRIVVGDKARRLIDITGLADRLHIFDDVDAAVGG